MQAYDSRLLADTPITKPEDDQLGVDPFAQRIAQAVLQMEGPEGFVIGLYGDWGSGKSSVLNLVEHHVRLADRKTPIIRFAPWWFNDAEQLLLQFFGTLIGELTRPGGRVGPLVKQIARYACQFLSPQLVAQVCAATGPQGMALAPMLSVAASAIRKALGESSPVGGAGVANLKASIDGKLVERQGRIVVLIDDIDRLPAEQIRELFRVVKAVADFSMITYVLAFDRAVVAAALSSLQNTDGDAYLRKIVQLPLDMPPIDPRVLGRMVQAEIARLVGSVESEEARSELEVVLQEGIRPALSSIRDAKRYINAVRGTFPAVRGEVYTPDFLALEGLRVFAPGHYRIVWENLKVLTRGRYLRDSATRAAAKSELDRIFQASGGEPTGHLLTLLGYLFPVVWAVYANRGDGVAMDLYRTWRQSRRLRCYQCADVYFRLAVPAWVLSRAHAGEMIEKCRTKRAAANVLEGLTQERGGDAVTRIEWFLYELEAQQRADPRWAEMWVDALLEAGDSLIARENGPGVGSEMAGAVCRAIEHLSSKAFPSPDRGEAEAAVAVSRKLPDAAALSTAVYFAHECQVEIRGVGEEESVSRCLLKRLRHLAGTGRLGSVPHLGLVLMKWAQWSGGDSEPSDAVAKLAECDKGLVAFLVGMSRIEEKSTAVGSEEDWVVRLKDVRRFGGEPEQYIERVRKMLDSGAVDMSTREGVVLTRFLERFTTRIGEPPDDDE